MNNVVCFNAVFFWGTHSGHLGYNLFHVQDPQRGHLGKQSFWKISESV